MASREKPPHHVRAHSSQANHPKLHRSLLLQKTLLNPLRSVHYLVDGGSKPLHGRGRFPTQRPINLGSWPRPPSSSGSDGSGYSLNYHDRVWVLPYFPVPG